MDIFIKNGHHTLDYMKESFDLLENMLSFATTEATSHSNGIRLRGLYAILQIFSIFTATNAKGCMQLWKIFGVPYKQ
jgi:hypothetical protein